MQFPTSSPKAARYIGSIICQNDHHLNSKMRVMCTLFVVYPSHTINFPSCDADTKLLFKHRIHLH